MPRPFLVMRSRAFDYPCLLGRQGRPHLRNSSLLPVRSRPIFLAHRSEHGVIRNYAVDKPTLLARIMILGTDLVQYPVPFL